MSDKAPAEWTKLDSPGFSAFVGPIFYHAGGDGEMFFRLDPKDRHGNRSGVLHGGMIMTLADIAAGNTLRRSDAGFGYTTVQTDVHFMNSASLAQSLLCRCRLRKRGRSLAFVDVELSSGDSLIASVKSIWRVVGSPS